MCCWTFNDLPKQVEKEITVYKVFGYDKEKNLYYPPFSHYGYAQEVKEGALITDARFETTPLVEPYDIEDRECDYIYEITFGLHTYKNLSDAQGCYGFFKEVKWLNVTPVIAECKIPVNSLCYSGHNDDFRGCYCSNQIKIVKFLS